MSKQKKKTRLKTRASFQSINPRVIDVKSKDLAQYARQAEQQVLPIIKELEMSAGAAIVVLSQYAQALISGSPHISLESAMTITDRVLALWQADSYHPSTQYPFTLEETLLDFKEGLKTTVDYSKYFQPFTSSHKNTPIGIGQVAAGIALHPKTMLWQTWMIVDGPCAILGVYRDPAEAQRSLERIINIARYGDSTIAKHIDAATNARYLYDDLISKGDGGPMQFPYDMMDYLLNNIHLYKIEL